MVPCGKKHYSRGLCNTHYQRWKKRGGPIDSSLLVARVYGREGCVIDGCEKEHMALGLCTMHWQRRKAHGDAAAPPQRVREKREHEKWCAGHDREGHWVLKTAFSKNRRTNDGLAYKCKECIALEKLSHNYNMTGDDYHRMVEKQSDSCAICGTGTPGGQGLWHVDHDHACCDDRRSCGACVRGLLCHRCNLGLGHFGDDPDRLLAAAAYVLSNSNIPTQKGSTAV